MGHRDDWRCQRCCQRMDGSKIKDYRRAEFLCGFRGIRERGVSLKKLKLLVIMLVEKELRRDGEIEGCI